MLYLYTPGPAGIRTMSLVSLASCAFTINSMFAFLSGPASFDAARVSAALPSGVGFLGAAVIWKHGSTPSTHQVFGLTTASSVWLSSAIGVAAGGALYFVAVFTTGLVMSILRFGPKNLSDDRSERSENGEGSEEGSETANIRNQEKDTESKSATTNEDTTFAGGDGWKRVRRVGSHTTPTSKKAVLSSLN